MTDKRDLFDRGVAQVRAWCFLNAISMPEINETHDPVGFGTCAYYRTGMIHIHVPSCATLGRVGRLWSWPGYTVDRTPYGVLCHELGHHVDRAHGAKGGTFGAIWRTEEPISSYCPNDNEWLAEMFRVYVTNPTLLQELRPATYAHMRTQWPVLAELRHWTEVLKDSPRHVAAVRNKLRKGAK